MLEKTLTLLDLKRLGGGLSALKSLGSLKVRKSWKTGHEYVDASVCC